MPDEPDILEEGGPEPTAEAPDAPDVAADAPDAPPAPPTFTPEDLASGLGSRYQERFAAHHEPAQALSEYGKSVEHLQSAYSRLSQGGEPTAEDRAAADALGIQLPEPQEEPDAPPEPIWGAPWVDPSDYEGVVAMVQRDPAQAMAFIDKQPDGVIDPDFRQQVLQYWASPEGGNNPAAMVAYERQKARDDAIEAARTYADERYAELEQRLTPLQQGADEANHQAVSAKIDLLVERAAKEIPEFNEYQDGVKQIVERYAAHYGIEYFTNLIALPPDQQIAHVREVVGAAMMAGRPAAIAEAEAERQQQEAAKAGAAGQRGRGANGSSNGSPQSELKKAHLASFERMKDIDVTV